MTLLDAFCVGAGTAMITHGIWVYVWLRHQDKAHRRWRACNDHECGCGGYWEKV